MAFTTKRLNQVLILKKILHASYSFFSWNWKMALFNILEKRRMGILIHV